MAVHHTARFASWMMSAATTTWASLYVSTMMTTLPISAYARVGPQQRKVADHPGEHLNWSSQMMALMGTVDRSFFAPGI